MGRYVQNLIVRVIDASEADTWENAVQECEFHPLSHTCPLI